VRYPALRSLDAGYHRKWRSVSDAYPRFDDDGTIFIGSADLEQLGDV
jgi:hypothetical protein